MGDGATGSEVFTECNEWMRAHIPDLGNIVI